MDEAPKPAGAPDAPKVRFVHRWTDAVQGRERAQFRRRGWPRVELDLRAGAAALADQVAAVLARYAPKEAKPLTLPGVLEVFINDLPTSGRALATQIDYTHRARELQQILAGVQLGDVDAAFVADLRDALAKRGYRVAGLHLQVLKQALKPAVRDKRLSEDPFAGFEKPRRPKDLKEPHPVWFDAEVRAVLEAAPPGVARAVALGRYAGADRGDAVKIRERPAGDVRLAFARSKTAGPVDRLADPRLTAVLAATPRRAVTIAYREDGRPFSSARAYALELKRALERLAADGVVRPGLTHHGLRHSFGVELAENGATDAEIQAAMGHLTPAMAARYRRQAERRKLSDRTVAGQGDAADLADLAAARAKRRGEAG